MTERETLSEFRNSEGLTPAEGWRREALRQEQKALVSGGQAATAERAATTYREMADAWDAEHDDLVARLAAQRIELLYWIDRAMEAEKAVSFATAIIPEDDPYAGSAEPLVYSLIASRPIRAGAWLRIHKGLLEVRRRWLWRRS